MATIDADAALISAYSEPGRRAGWEPDTPPEDTLLRRYLLNLADANAGPVTALGGRVLRRDDVVAADLGRPTGWLFNSAVLLQPLGSSHTEDTLDAIEAFYATGRGQVSLWSAWPTPDLRRRGWTLEGHPPLLVRPPAPLPGRPAPPADLRIEPVHDPAGVRDWERVLVDGFPFDELQPLVPGSLVDERILDERRLRLWVGYQDSGTPMCAAALFTHAGLAQLLMAATLPHGRRRGYYDAIARHRLRAEPDLPAGGLFSNMSRPGAQALGFLPLLRFTAWTRTRPGSTTT